jgi:phosphoribosylformylglycinamidine synthase subunit PurL
VKQAIPDTSSSTVQQARDMGLSDDEYARAQQILGRVPNHVELGCFAAMWSEHCSYKSSRVHLRSLPTTGPGVLVGPGENAGVVDVGEGWAVAFKVESHNHPSYIEPYQGAATGVGGILRDVFTMGARPIAAMNLLRFGRPDHEKTPHLLSGVVRGIGGYGNCFGVPTVYSSADFDAAYDGNILVNAFALGVLRADRIFKGTASGVGNPVMYVGAKTGRDGIHGATMASDSFSEGEEAERPTVQVGDPFKEKLLLEACQECFQAAKDEGGLLVGIQDMGAAGLTSSCFEMASRAGSGVRIDLDKVPQRETGMTAYELMLSESQERMLLVAKRGREEEVRRIFERWDLDCTVIGEVTDDGMVRLSRHGAEVAVLPARELADEAPRYERPFVKPAPLPALDEEPLRRAALGDVARAVLLSPTVAPKGWIYERYDREVGAGTLLDGAQAPAALVRVPGTERAVAMALVCDGRVCASAPREGARRAVVEAVLRIAAVGAAPLGTTDCLNYGNPQRPEIMGQIVEGIAGIKDACLALDAPVVSGNVSLYNSTDERAIHPTPAIGVVGLVERFADVAPRPAVEDGDVVVRLGRAPATLAGSLALSLMHGGRPSGALPALDLAEVKALAGLVRDLVRERKLKDARPIVAGGLVAALAELAGAGPTRPDGRGRGGLGLFADVPAGEDPAASCFGEDQAAFVVVVAPAALTEVSRRAAAAGIPFVTLGGVGGHRLTVAVQQTSTPAHVAFELDIAALRAEAEAVVPRIVSGSQLGGQR